jgi:hypothetical protein
MRSKFKTMLGILLAACALGAVGTASATPE